MNTQPTFEIREMEGHNVAVITYPDGSMFTPIDWQSRQPQSPEEIDLYTWFAVNPANPGDTDQWQPAILLQGWPQLLG